MVKGSSCCIGSQPVGVDFHETFSPVVSCETTPLFVLSFFWLFRTSGLFISEMLEGIFAWFP